MKFVRFPGTSGDYASTPDNAAFSAPTDFSLVALISADDYTPAAGMNIASHRTTTGNQRAWQWTLGATGTLNLSLSLDGSAQTAHTSTATTGFTDGTVHWVMVTRTSSSGDVKFYTADYVPGSVDPPSIGSFTQLGSTVNNGITGALHNSTSVLEVASTQVGTANLFDGDLYRFAFYSGIYGSGSESLVRDFSPTDAANTGVTSWTAGTTGETWTLNGGDPKLFDYITGTSAQTLGAFTSTASGSTVTGTSAQTLDTFTGTASGSTVTGTSAQTLGVFTSNAAGGTGPNGTVAATLDVFTSDGAGSSVTGTLAVTLDAFPGSGAGTVGEVEPEPVITPAPTPGGYTPSREDRAMWDDEATRLRIIRDEDDLLLLI